MQFGRTKDFFKKKLVLQFGRNKDFLQFSLFYFVPRSSGRRSQ